MFKNNIRPCIFAFCFLLIWSLPTYAASSKVVVSMGVGIINDGDNAVSAKKEAVSNGLLTAIESAAEEILPKEILVHSFPEIYSILHNHYKKFIKGYKVLAEKEFPDKYNVLMESEVLVNKIKASLSSSGIVITDKEKPRVLCLVAEQNLEDIDPQFWWGKGRSYVKTVSDDSLTDMLKKRGFEVIGHRTISETNGKNELSNDLGAEIKYDNAIIIGKNLAADFVITGKAAASLSANSMGATRTYSAIVDLNVFRVDSGEKIVSASDSAVSVNQDEVIGSREALVKASEKACGLIAPLMVEALKKKNEVSSMFELVVTGENFFFNYIKLSEVLSRIPELKRLQQKEKRIDRAVLVVDYQGSSQQLANTLLAKTFENFGIVISDVSRRKMHIQIVSK